ncbi:hypothetical protein FA13DRAFT_1797067 [Coprinellus micaceus]|uniref:Uncharacterized protein n=1 Tax=Coprinellus micaceus TaxID=71717 RepID=A0A4Y7SSL3_COPMI|nr:hypothetical protein FA13DRAFT_1797067 [Coprinellus micaceus]
MKTFTAIRIGLTIAAALYTPVIMTADVTLYAPDHTPTDVYISRTGDFAVKACIDRSEWADCI